MAYEKMTFKGTRVWFDRQGFEEHGHAALASSEWGHFAHAFNDVGVKQRGEKIGEVSDLVPGWPSASAE